ncbi:MAG TPA: GNAT family N-acetyltransferase [Burkholderiaceae bacterium]
MIEISCDKTRLDIPLIHAFLTTESTWAIGIGLPLVQKALDNSLCFGAYENDKQVGFARVVTDCATFGYLCDVMVPTEHRGRGISRLLMDAVTAHPDLQGLRRFTLVTSTAASLYAKYGWTPLHAPAAHMERFDPDIYKR